MQHSPPPVQQSPPAGHMHDVTIVQLNCNRRSEVSPDLARLMIDRGWSVALLQEHSIQRATGLPAGFPRGMRSFCCPGRNDNLAAVVVNAPDIEAMPIGALTNEWDVCVDERVVR